MKARGTIARYRTGAFQQRLQFNSWYKRGNAFDGSGPLRKTHENFPGNSDSVDYRIAETGMGMKWILSAGFLCLINAATAGLPESQKAANDAHQAILTEGWHTSPAAAAQLESQLTSHPQDVAARVRLISHYYQQMIAEPRARHILWLIENHPEAEIFQIASDVTSLEITWHGLNSAADQDKARALWRRQLERFSNDTAVLASAAQALPVEESIPVVRRLRILEPSSPVGTVNLASVYARAVQDALYTSSHMQRRAMGGPVRYRDMWQMRLPVAGPHSRKS